jgi:hypothetical protein
MLLFHINQGLLGNPKAGDLSQIRLATKQKWTSAGYSSPARTASPHNKALQLTANPLCGLSAAELGRYVALVEMR